MGCKYTHCFTFPRLCFCQKLSKSDNIWQSYDKHKRVTFILRHSVCPFNHVQLLNTRISNVTRKRSKETRQDSTAVGYLINADLYTAERRSQERLTKTGTHLGNGSGSCPGQTRVASKCIGQGVHVDAGWIKIMVMHIHSPSGTIETTNTSNIWQELSCAEIAAQCLFRDMPTNFYWNRFIFDRHRAKEKLARFLRHSVYPIFMW